MFDTLELQQLNKLVKGEVRDLTSPKTLHAVYVQCFKSQCIKAPTTKVSREFPMPVFALVGNFTIKPREFPDRTPPIMRTFFLTRKTLVESTEVFQGLFQELRRLYLPTCGKRQVSIFHTEVCTHTFTRSGQGFGRSIVSYDVKPVFTNGIAKDLERIGYYPSIRGVDGKKTAVC